MIQKFFFLDKSYRPFCEYFKENKFKNILLVHGKSYKNLSFSSFFNRIANENCWKIFEFTDFHSNPGYESVKKGVEFFQKIQADVIFVVGGGSAIDTAKCIKLYGRGNTNEFLLTQKNCCADIPLAVLPTTAGTGSETTRFSVIYVDGEKMSVTSDEILPDVIFFDSSVLVTLPLYQRKSTFLDAFCHAVESYWSVNANETSRTYSVEAIKLLLSCRNYIDSPDIFCYYDLLLYASYLAGKAINISETTAGHAMCYKLTSIFGLSHGHAAALCVVRLWRYMIERNEVPQIMHGLNGVFGFKNSEETVLQMEQMLKKWELSSMLISENDETFSYKLQTLVHSVNAKRLKNHPINLSVTALEGLYKKILKGAF